MRDIRRFVPIAHPVDTTPILRIESHHKAMGPGRHSRLSSFAG